MYKKGRITFSPKPETEIDPSYESGVHHTRQASDFSFGNGINIPIDQGHMTYASSSFPSPPLASGSTIGSKYTSSMSVGHASSPSEREEEPRVPEPVAEVPMKARRAGYGVMNGDPSRRSQLPPPAYEMD